MSITANPHCTEATTGSLNFPISMPGVKGRRIPGRPGRFDPTIPLHMTTRRKAAKTGPDMEMYPEDEYDDAESRRTSLDDISVTTPNSRFDSEPPAKRQRTVDPSPQRSTMSLLDQEELSKRVGKSSSNLFDVGPDAANGSQSSSGGAFATQTDVDVSQDSIDPRHNNDDEIGERQAASPDVPATEGGSGRDEASIRPDQDQSNGMRQEYEASNGADVDDEGVGGYSQSGSFETHRKENEAYQSIDENDWTGAVNPLPTARDFESRDASVESSTSDVQAVRDLPLPEVSTDATPMATRQVSPATTASPAVGDLTPARTKPSTTLGLTNSEDDEDGEADDVEPATEFQDSIMENMEDDVDATRYADEYEDDVPVQKTTKRRFAGGRRRAAHSNANVEAALRRQLEIKQFYRQVTRSMKACLGELAQITLDELEAESQHHTQVTEYDSVIAELDEQLARRKQQVLSAQRFNHEQLQQRYEAERDSRTNRCRNLLEDIKEQQLVNLEYNMLQVNRAKLRDEAKAGHETEDEDGVIPRPKRTAYRFKRSNALDLRYDSRSRFTMETERRVDDLQRRTNMWEALQAYAPEAITTFTVMDSGAREAAEEKRKNIQITSALADIAAEFDRMYNMPKPPKPPPQPTAAELAPLNALAELAVKPAIRSSRSQAMPLPSSSMPGFPTQSPRQGRIPLPSQSILERSAANLPNHNQNPFRRLAIEQNRVPAQSFGQFPISSLLSPSVRPSEEPPAALPTAGLPRSIESKPTLAAKPEQVDNERPKHAPSHLLPQQLDPVLRDLLASGAKLDPDRACQIADEVARSVGQELTDESKQKLRTQVEQTGSQHMGANNDNDDQARRDPMRNTSSLPPLSDMEEQQRWRGPITNRSERDGMTRRESGLRPSRNKRSRESDPLEALDGVRDVRPRAGTSSSTASQRPRSTSELRADEQRRRDLDARSGHGILSPRSRQMAGLPNTADFMLPRPSEPHGLPRPESRDRRLSSQSHHDRRPSVGNIPARRASDLHHPPPHFQQQQQQQSGPTGPPPGFPTPSFMQPLNWPPPNAAQMYGQPPQMPVPTAQPIDHFAMSQGRPGGSWGQPPYQPGGPPSQHVPPTQQQQPPPPGNFRNYFAGR